MISSMTGFGHGEASSDNRTITVEIKAVNHRYLDLTIKSPRSFNAFEGYIRNYLSERISRGKVDVFVTYDESADNQYEVVYNSHIAKMYYDKIKEISEEFDINGDISASLLSRYNEVLELKEIEESQGDLQGLLSTALEGAYKEFEDSRISEGSRLCDDLLDKLDALARHVAFIEKRSPIIVDEYKAKLQSKISDLLNDNNIDDGRIAMEVTIMADKVCVDEEIVRLKSHIQEVRDTLNKGSSVGRKLDFLAQELNREANTILSKSTDVDIASKGIELKTLIEMIREQIQNIE